MLTISPDNTHQTVFITFEVTHGICQYVLDLLFFFFKQKTAYEILRSDWSSDCALPISFARPRGPARKRRDRAGTGRTARGEERFRKHPLRRSPTARGRPAAQIPLSPRRARCAEHFGTRLGGRGGHLGGSRTARDRRGPARGNLRSVKPAGKMRRGAGERPLRHPA